MAFFIQTFDHPGVEKLRTEYRQAHLEYLDNTRKQLIACGAKLCDTTGQPTGGIYLVDFDTFEEAEAYIAEDPFSKVGLFEKVQIERWRKAFLEGKRYVDLGDSGR